MRAEYVVIQPEDCGWLSDLGLGSVAEVMAYPGTPETTADTPDESFTIDLDPSLKAPRRIRVRRHRHTRDSSVVFGLLRGVPWRDSETRHECELILEMSRLGLQVERPIAHGEHRSCGLFHEGFIITEVPIHAESLDTAAMRHCTARGIPEIDRRRFLEALGAAVGRMHCAGVQHGSLFAGNILVSETSDGGWRFTFTRPGRRARSFDQSVPYGGVIADLAELAASGAGFGRFQDVALFMRAYRRAMAGAKLDKRVVRDVLAAAGSRIVPTGCELALTEALRWVQRRVNAESAGGRARSMRTFASIDSFLEAVVSVEAPPLPSNKSETIGFTLSARGRDAPPRRFLLRMTERGIAIHPGCDGEAELCIETDDDAWLSVVNAAAIAPQTIRNHRIRIRGNMERLRALLALVQAIQRSSSSSAHGSEATE